MKVNRRFGGHIVFIFRLEELAKQETSDIEDGSDITFRNVD
jgi:hypothetical protein